MKYIRPSWFVTPKSGRANVLIEGIILIKVCNIAPWFFMEPVSHTS